MGPLRKATVWVGIVFLQGCLDSDPTTTGRLPIKKPIGDIHAEMFSSVESIIGLEWPRTDGQSEGQVLFRDPKSLVLKVGESQEIRTKPLGGSFSQDQGKLARVRLFYSNTADPLDFALFEIDRIAREYSIVESAEVKEFLAKLRQKQPVPTAGSTWNLNLNVNDNVSVSLILVASTNETGWYVQSHFSSSRK